MMHPSQLKQVSKNHKQNENLNVNRNKLVFIIQHPPLKRLSKIPINTSDGLADKSMLVSIDHDDNISSSVMEKIPIDATQTKVVHRQLIASKPMHDTNNNLGNTSVSQFSKRASSTKKYNSQNPHCQNDEYRQIEQEKLHSTTITANLNFDINSIAGLQRTHNNDTKQLSPSTKSETKAHNEKGIQCELSDEELDIVNGNGTSAQEEHAPVETTKHNRNSALEVGVSGNFHVKNRLQFNSERARKSVTNNFVGENNNENVLKERSVIKFFRLLKESSALVQNDSDPHGTLKFPLKRSTDENICHIKRKEHATQFQFTPPVDSLPAKHQFQDRPLKEHYVIVKKGAEKQYESEMDIAGPKEYRSLNVKDMNIAITRQQNGSDENIMHKDSSDRSKVISRKKGVKTKNPTECRASNSQCKPKPSRTGNLIHGKEAALVDNSSHCEFLSASATGEYLPKHKSKEANNETAVNKSNAKKIYLESRRKRMSKKLYEKNIDLFNTSESLMQQDRNVQASEHFRFNNDASDKRTWKRKWCKLARTIGNIIPITKPLDTFEFAEDSDLSMNIRKSQTIDQTPRVLTNLVPVPCDKLTTPRNKNLEFVSENEPRKTLQSESVASQGVANSRAMLSGTDRLLLEPEGTKIVCSICRYTHFIECIDFVSRELFCYNCGELLNLQNCDWSSSNICCFCGQVNRLSIKNGCLPNLVVCCFCSCTADRTTKNKLYSTSRCEEDNEKQFLFNTEMSSSTVIVSDVYDRGVCDYGLFMHGEELDVVPSDSSHSDKTASTDLEHIKIGKIDVRTDNINDEKCVAMLKLTSLKRRLPNMEETFLESAKNTKLLRRVSESPNLPISMNQNRLVEASFHVPKTPLENRLSCHCYSRATEKSSGKTVCSNKYMNRTRVLSPHVQKYNNHEILFMSQSIPNYWSPLEVGKYSRSENGCLTALYSNCSSGTSVTWSCDYSFTDFAPDSSFCRMSPNRPNCLHSKAEFGSDSLQFAEPKETSLPTMDNRNQTRDNSDNYVLKTPVNLDRSKNDKFIDKNKVQRNKTDKNDGNLDELYEGHSSVGCRSIIIGKEDQHLNVDNGSNTIINCQLNDCKDVAAVEAYCSLRKKSLQEKDPLCLLDSSSKRPELCVYLDDIKIDPSVGKSLRYVYTSRSYNLSPENKVIKYFGKFVYLDKITIVSVIKNKLKPALLKQLRQRRKRKANPSLKCSRSGIAKWSTFHGTSRPSVGNEPKFNNNGQLSSFVKPRVKRKVMFNTSAVDSTVSCPALNCMPRYETTQIADLPRNETVLGVIDSDQLTPGSLTPRRSVAVKSHASAHSHRENRKEGQTERTAIEYIPSISCTKVEDCDQLKTRPDNTQREREALLDDATQKNKSKDKCPQLEKQEQKGFPDFSVEMIPSSCKGNHSQDDTNISLLPVKNFGLFSDFFQSSGTPRLTYCETSPSDVSNLHEVVVSLGGLLSIPPEKPICLETDCGMVKEMAIKHDDNQMSEYFTFDLDFGDKCFGKLDEPTYSGTLNECSSIASGRTSEEFDVTDPEYEELLENESCHDFRNKCAV